MGLVGTYRWGIHVSEERQGMPTQSRNGGADNEYGEIVSPSKSCSPHTAAAMKARPGRLGPDCDFELLPNGETADAGRRLGHVSAGKENASLLTSPFIGFGMRCQDGISSSTLISVIRLS